MAALHSLLPAPPVALTTPCPNCGNELRVYVFAQPTKAENTPKGLVLHIESSHLIGPHACCVLPADTPGGDL